MIELYEDQKEFIGEIRRCWRDHKRFIGYLPTGGGKCLGIDTPVLMHDGTVKKVQNIVVGDKLMGPDSNPRNVISLARGQEMLYRVSPVKGDSYVVNESHILSLKGYGAKDSIVNVSVKEYLNSTKTFRHTHKGWRCGVEFPEKKYCRYLPPYMLGLWLGDGTTGRPDITTPDSEILEYLKSYAKSTGLNLKDITCGDRCKTYTLLHDVKGCGLTASLKRLGIFNDKRIPIEYKTGSREQRMELLAGLLDTDGYSHKSCIDFIFKQKVLADDVAYLCRSLGFAAYVVECEKTATNTGATGTYYRISVSGECHLIPNKIGRKKGIIRSQVKSVLKTGITVDPIGVGEYFGFEIDGDHLFLLGDFTVTHNTRCAAFIVDGMNQRGMKVVFTVPRLSLLQQTLESFTELGINATVYHRDHEYMPSAPCVITTLQTMTRRGKVPADLYIVDEAHKRSKTFLDWMDEDKEMRVIGLTATPFPAWLGKYFTGIAKGKSMRWLIDNGRLADYDVYAADIPDLTGVKSRSDSNGDPDYVDSMLAEVMGDAKLLGNIVSTWLDVGENRPTIALCVNVMHANELANQFESVGVTVDVITAKTKDREPRFQKFRDGLTKILLAVDTLTEGADFPFCSCLINARPTKSLCRYVQGLGRVLRWQEGKRAIIIDHSGDILRPNLGYPCSIDVDGLPTGDDGKKQSFTEVTKEQFEKLPKQCKKCKYVKPAGVHQCPQCGFAPRAGEDIETAREIGLKLITAEKPKVFTQDDKQAYWSGLMGLRQQHINAGKNRNINSYKHMYRDKFGCWPRSLSDTAKPPTQEILGKWQSKMIAYAKSKKKAAQ